MTLSEALLLVIALAAVVAAVAIAVLAGRIGRAASEIERLTGDVRELLPRVERVLEGTERELARFEQVAERADRIAADIETVSNKARKAVVPALDLASGLSKPVRYLHAAITGVSVGLALLRRLRAASNTGEEATNGDSGTSGQEAPVAERKEVTP
jgi:uncharacterized protein YoxC